MVARRVVVHPRDVVFLKGVLEATDGLASLFAERGGDLTIAAPSSREEELDAVLAELALEIDVLAGPCPASADRLP